MLLELLKSVDLVDRVRIGKVQHIRSEELVDIWDKCLFVYIFIELVGNILAEIKVLTVVIFYVVGIILILDPKGGTF